MSSAALESLVEHIAAATHAVGISETMTPRERINALVGKLTVAEADLARARERIGELAGEKAATESSGWKAGMEQGRIDGLMTALGIANAYDYDPVGRSIAEILRPLVREGANRDG